MNLVYWGIGNPAADFYGGDRAGANLYTDCVVALDADTGEVKWSYQEIPHDVWDWDSAYECVLIDRVMDGVPRKLLVHPNKGGYTWVLDRTNGQFINAWRFANNLNWITGIDDKGRLLGRNEPPEGKPTLICPSVSGGRSWNHGSFSPKTGFFYTVGIEYCDEITVRKEEAIPGEPAFGGVFQMKPPPNGEAGGHLNAYDPVTGKQQWSYVSKYPILASTLATGGDLIFSGDPEGHFFALDAFTGQQLWSFSTGWCQRDGDRQPLARCRKFGLKWRISRAVARCLCSRCLRPVYEVPAICLATYNVLRFGSACRQSAVGRRRQTGFRNELLRRLLSWRGWPRWERPALARSQLDACLPLQHH